MVMILIINKYQFAGLGCSVAAYGQNGLLDAWNARMGSFCFSKFKLLRIFPELRAYEL
jgi:hypothetical protein